jgi:hypothetical protein
MQQIKTPSSLLFLSSPQMGKSVWIRYLLQTMCKAKRFNHGFIFSPTDHEDYKFVPESWRFSDWQPEKVQKLMDKQKELMKQGRNIQAFVVFDDIIGTFNMKDKLIEKLMTTYRHYNLTVFVACQWVTKCPPSVRNSANYVFMFQQSMALAIDALYDSYGQLFETQAQFKKVLQQCTKDYNVLLYDRLAPPEINKKYKIVKAQVVRDIPFVDVHKRDKSQAKNLTYEDNNEEEDNYNGQTISRGMYQASGRRVYNPRGQQRSRFTYLQ